LASPPLDLGVDLRLEIAERFYDATTTTIDAVLSATVPPSQHRKMQLETIKDEWPDFWSWIGADGNLDCSVAAWDIKRNTGEERGEA